MKKLNLTAMAVVLGLALGAQTMADTIKAPTPVKSAQPAAKTPVTPVTPATPTSTTTGKKPMTAPSGRASVNKRLPDTTLPLYINNISIPTTVSPTDSASVTWVLSRQPDLNASGVHLLVHTSSLESVNCAAPPATASPDSGKYMTPSHALTLGNPYYRDRQTYYIRGCVFNRTTDPFGQVTDSYTGDMTNQGVLHVDVRPDLLIWAPSVRVHEPVYKVGPNWFENMAAITSFPPLVPFPNMYAAATWSNIPGNHVVTLTLNNKKHRVTVPGGRWSSAEFKDVPVDNLWKDYLNNPRLIVGVIYIDEENHIVESNEWNNFGQTKIEALHISPKNLRITRTAAGLQLDWQQAQHARNLVDEYHIIARFSVKIRPGLPVYRRFSVSGNMNTISSSQMSRLPPWSDMVDNRACFRVVGLSRRQQFPGLELVSAPSNEVCFAVRDRRN